MDPTSLISAQVRLSRRLALGFVFTFVPLFSLIPLIIGIRSLRAISESHGALAGRKMALWCAIVGGLETLLVLYCLIAIFMPF